MCGGATCLNDCVTVIKYMNNSVQVHRILKSNYSVIVSDVILCKVSIISIDWKFESDFLFIIVV